MNERVFDWSEIIIDPKKLESGKEYYTSDWIDDLKERFEGDRYAKTYTGIVTSDGLYGMIRNERYRYFYPREQIKEPKYKPYENLDLAWLGKKVKAKAEWGKADEETAVIEKITYGLRGEFVNLSNGIMFSLGMMFDYFTWEDGTPFGEVE